MLERRLPLLIGLLLLLVGCSLPWNRPATPEQRATIIGITTDYLVCLVQGNDKKLSSLVVWEDLLGKGSRRETSKQELDRELRVIQNIRPLDQHPLLGLEVLDVYVSGNQSKVTLRKAGKSDFPKIWVKLYWSGSGWLVVEDSIIGKGKLADTLAEKKAKSEKKK